MNIKALIFDLDGTLLDSMPAWDNIGLDYLLKKGLTPPQNLKSTLRNMSFGEAAAYFITVLGLALPADQIIAEINGMVEEQYKQRLQLKPYAKEFLAQAKRKGLKMGLVTSSDRQLADHALQRLGVRPYFQFILTCEETGKSKNHPDIYLEAAALLGYPPGEIAVFEDALYCIKTAKEAGFFVVAVADRHAERELPEISACCDRYLESYRGALETLE